mmetsp:Transcript_17144/g.19716  ORF Transcript_17144/g.19716 Transcript_17144/m.19716 type:complete len:197 (+) Transcript_17144:58-648(+)
MAMISGKMIPVNTPIRHDLLMVISFYVSNRNHITNTVLFESHQVGKLILKLNEFQDDSYRPADIPSPSNEEGRGFFVKAAHCVTSHVKSLEDINKRSQCRLREKDDKIYELKFANSRLKDDLEYCHRRDSGRKRRRTYDNSAVGRHNRNQFSDARSEHRRTSNGDNFPRIDEQENSSRTAKGRHSYGSPHRYNILI